MDKVDVPPQEQWLFQNKVALKKVLKGLQESADGNIVSAKKDFSKYLSEENTSSPLPSSRKL